jgi:hypothetical protein
MANKDPFRNDFYFNFPIEIVKTAFTDITGTCGDIISYAIYDRFQKMELGDDEEKIKSVFSYLNINNSDWKGSISRGRRVFNSIENHKVKTGAKNNIVFQYRDEYQNDFKIAVFVAYCALRSIIGVKTHVGTSNDFLIARMCGYAKKEGLSDGLTDGLGQFYTRRKLDKIKKELIENWGLKYYAQGVMGFYAGFNIELEELIYLAEKNKFKNKIDRQKEEFNEAKNKALERLRNEK